MVYTKQKALFYENYKKKEKLSDKRKKCPFKGLSQISVGASTVSKII